MGYKETYQESAYDIVARHVYFLSGHMAKPRMAGYFIPIPARRLHLIASANVESFTHFCKIIRYREFRNQITMVFPPGTMTGMPSTESHTSIADGFNTRE